MTSPVWNELKFPYLHSVLKKNKRIPKILFQRSIQCLLATFLLFAGSIHSERTSQWDQCGCEWRDWGAWGTCDKECYGVHSRSRRVAMYTHEPGCVFAFETCATSDSGHENSMCNTFCHNGGTSKSYWCSCVTGFYGKCCGFRKNIKYTMSQSIFLVDKLLQLV